MSRERLQKSFNPPVAAGDVLKSEILKHRKDGRCDRVDKNPNKPLVSGVAASFWVNLAEKPRDHPKQES